MAQTFGTVWHSRSKEDITLPAPIPQPSVYLESNSLLCIILWSVCRYGMDTTTGKVALFPITITTPSKSVQCVMGHWSMLQQVMINLFTGFRNGIRQKQIQEALGPLTIRGLSKADLAEWIRISGTKVVNKPRLMEHSHFLIPVEMFMSLARVMESYQSPEDFLYCEKTNSTQFCMDHVVTMEKLKEANLFVSAWTITHVFQSNTPNWLMLKVRPFEYDDDTPAFGIPYWDTLVKKQFDLYRAYARAPHMVVTHLKSLYKQCHETAIEPRSVLIARFSIGVIPDVPEHRYSDHNQAAKRRRKLYEEFCREKGLALPGRGRPRKSETAVRKVVKKVREMLQDASGLRPMKKNRTEVPSVVSLTDVKRTLPSRCGTARMTPQEIQEWLAQFR